MSDKLSREELRNLMKGVVAIVANGLMTQRLADDILQPVFTALALYDENEKMKEGIEGLIEHYKITWHALISVDRVLADLAEITKEAK